MLTEVEKYEQIQRFLAKQLSLSEQKSFESEMQSSEALRAEVEMHRLANEIAIDHYVIGLKATTSKVMKQKRVEQRWRNWGLGLGLGIVAATLGWYTLTQDQPKATINTEPAQKIVQPIIVPPNPDIELPKETEVAAKVSVQKETATPTKVSVAEAQATTEPSMIDMAPISSASISPASPAVSSVPQKVTTETKVASRPIAKEAEDIRPVEKPKEIVAPVELVLNPLQGTEVELPVDADFTGEFSVFDANGTSVYRCFIQNGQPHTWDGRVISGGTAGAGQYGFVLKSSSGKESVGYVTVVR